MDLEGNRQVFQIHRFTTDLYRISSSLQRTSLYIHSGEYKLRMKIFELIDMDGVSKPAYR